MLDVVLVAPEIPNNTGNIGRTCVATGASLHLVRPLGFDTDEKACRRAGLDYWPRLRVKEHDDFGAYLRDAGPGRLWLFTTRCQRPYFEADLRPGDALVFGSETRGLSREILDAYPQRHVLLPMVPGERSLNLATAVCAAVYEGVRQMIGRGELSLDATGRLHGAYGSEKKS